MGMEPLWSVRSYIKAIGAAILLIGAGLLIVISRAPVAPADGSGAWTGGGAILGGTPNTDLQPAQPQQQPILATVTSSAPFVYLAPNGQAAQTGPAADGPDLASIVAQFMPKTKTPLPTHEGPGTFFDAYSLVPSGLFATTTEKSRTDMQGRLFDYGNEAGSYIQGYESMHQTVPQIARDQLADRANPDKRDALIGVANDLIGLGKQLAQMEEVPAPVRAQHNAIAAGYQSIGKALIPVANAQSDQQLLDAIKTYDTTVDAFTKHYVALVLLFPSYGVSFKPDDSGSVFSFNPSL